MEKPYYEIVVEDSWELTTFDDGVQGYTFKSIIDNPLTGVDSFDCTGNVLTQPNLIATKHLCKTQAPLDVLHNDLNFKTIYFTYVEQEQEII